MCRRPATSHPPAAEHVPDRARRRLARGEGAAFGEPEIVADAPTLEAIYRLRVAVWIATGDASPATFPEGRWSDEHDAGATHRVFRNAGQVVAAGRQSLHDRLADVPEAEAYAAAGLELEGRISAPAHLVVAAAARRHDLARKLADAQHAAARAAGCTFSVCQASPAMRKVLLRRRWQEVGPGPPDARFPGVPFVVMVRDLAP